MELLYVIIHLYYLCKRIISQNIRKMKKNVTLHKKNVYKIILFHKNYYSKIITISGINFLKKYQTFMFFILKCLHFYVNLIYFPQNNSFPKLFHVKHMRELSS